MTQSKNLDYTFEDVQTMMYSFKKDFICYYSYFVFVLVVCSAAFANWSIQPVGIQLKLLWACDIWMHDELCFCFFFFFKKNRKQSSQQQIVVPVTGIPYQLSTYQLTEENTDFSYRDKRHQSSMVTTIGPQWTSEGGGEGVGCGMGGWEGYLKPLDFMYLFAYWEVMFAFKLLPGPVLIPTRQYFISIVLYCPVHDENIYLSALQFQCQYPKQYLFFTLLGFVECIWMSSQPCRKLIY